MIPKRIMLLLLSAVLLALGFMALFPFTVAKLLIPATVGLSISFEIQLAAFGGAAAMAGIWALTSAFRASR